MTERFTRFQEFDSQTAAEALGTESRALRDVAHGDGAALSLGETTLEVYRDAGVARVTTEDARVEIHRVPRFVVSPRGVLFEQGDADQRRRLLVRGDGNVSFYPVLRATEPATTAGNAATGEQSAPPPVHPFDSRTAGHHETAATPEAQERQAVQLTGRLGRDPWFNSQGDEPLAGFPLAVNDESSGKTTWHRVVTFGETAAQVNAAAKTGDIRKGRLVEVTGQQVTRAEETARGGIRNVQEFHASEVARLRATKQPPRR
jgi:hypothetical protein